MITMQKSWPLDHGGRLALDRSFCRAKAKVHSHLQAITTIVDAFCPCARKRSHLSEGGRSGEGVSAVKAPKIFKNNVAFWWPSNFIPPSPRLRTRSVRWNEIPYIIIMIYVYFLLFVYIYPSFLIFLRLFRWLSRFSFMFATPHSASITLNTRINSAFVSPSRITHRVSTCDTHFVIGNMRQFSMA